MSASGPSIRAFPTTVLAESAYSGVAWEHLPRDHQGVPPTPPSRGETVETDVLVVGGGPSGAAAAYWLAEAGHRVLVVEKKRFPREKTCGDGLTPRAVRQLEDMGLGERLAAGHLSATTASARSPTG